MCNDISSFTEDEQAALGLVKACYLGSLPTVKCHPYSSIEANWLGPREQLIEALDSLIKLGCLVSGDPGTWCLTECGLQAIGALPPTPAGPR
jgi:hypothetical protein